MTEACGLCGQPAAAEARFCTACGATLASAPEARSVIESAPEAGSALYPELRLPSPGDSVLTRTNGLAVASLVLGIVSLGIGSILALVFGYRGRRQIDESGGVETGRGLAVAGIILGWVGLLGLGLAVLIASAYDSSTATTRSAPAAASDPDARPLASIDHWHAAIGFNRCGEWLRPVPAFDAEADTGRRAGVHTHNDGLIHLHPQRTDEAGEHATVGRFVSNGGWELDESAFVLWDGVTASRGDSCSGDPAELIWTVNGERGSGNPAEYRPNDLDVIAIAFVPPGVDVGPPPSAAMFRPPDLIEA